MNLLLFRSGWVLIGLTLVLILFQVIPPKPFDPQWQLSLITSLLANGYISLMGAVFICYSCRRDDLDNQSLAQARFLRTFFGWLSLGFLLLVPVQFLASTGIVKANYFNGMSSMRQLEKVISNLRETRSEQEFREQLAKFPDMPSLPPKFDQPYQEVRETIVQTLSSRRVAAINQFAKTRDDNLQLVIKESFRNSASLVLFAFGFMTVSVSDPAQRTVITSLGMMFEKIRAGNLWFASPRRRKGTAINPSWVEDDQP